MKTERLKNREITSEMKDSYLDYAMSVIVSRALPDARDGLKPVQRRILYTMYEEKLTPNAKFRKSANIVGLTMSRLHPHGDLPIYEALVRMAQDFNLRYPLISGRGNFGSIDGDPPGQMRYTECRLSKIGEEMLKDIEKKTVDFEKNYDGSRFEPKVLPSPLPNLLINGTLGIAVGMATSIPPHNLGEVLDALVYLISHPNASLDKLMSFIKGPDFPTGGEIYDLKEIKKAYRIGKGGILMRAKAEIVEKKGKRYQIIITEIPYQVPKANLLAQIANLVAKKKIKGIRAIRDESDKEGLKISIDIRGGFSPKAILEKLYKLSDLSKIFYLNSVALVDGIQPKQLSLKEILLNFLTFRRKIIKRRTKFDLKKAKERYHILSGILKCLKKINETIKIIKGSRKRKEAFLKLKKKFDLTDLQANAILDLKLSSLVRMERVSLEKEIRDLLKRIKELEEILKNPKRIDQIIKNEFRKLKEKFADSRRTKVFKGRPKEASLKELIPNQPTVIILTKKGYLKRTEPQEFKIQKRGGKGILGIKLKKDFLSHFKLANTHDNLLFFTDLGRVFLLKAYEIPLGERNWRGKGILNFLEMRPSEKVLAILPVSPEFKDGYLVMATKKGFVKKTALYRFKNIRKSGMIAINLDKDDELRAVSSLKKNEEIILTTASGMAVRFKEKDLREMGRISRGVRGIKLKKEDEVISLSLIEREKKGELLLITENGFAKRTPLSLFKTQKRGGIGMRAVKTTKISGKLVFSQVIPEGGEVLISSSKMGQVIKIDLSSIAKLKRNARGVKIMKLADGDKVISAVII